MLEQFKQYPHCESAYIYAQHVVNGHKSACREEKLAAKRFLKDLKRKRYPYTFDVEQAERACDFVEELPHTKGDLAGSPLILEPWECFIVVNIFGWLNKKTRRRRFREAYLRIPRKNGKSLLAAAIGLYMFVVDGEMGGEIYSGATTEVQAHEVWRPAKQICERTDELCMQFGIEVNASRLVVPATGSFFKTMIGNPGDGSSPHCAIVDEYHEHDSDNMVGTMRTGMGARSQPLLLILTTAGSSHGGPCHVAELEYKQVLEGNVKKEHAFIVMYGIDDDDDWRTKEALIKANPNYGISVYEDFLLEEQQSAIEMASQQGEFKRKHLNVWTGAYTSFLNMERYTRCCEKLDIEDFKGETCVFALDLASKIDLTAFLQVFSKVIDDELHYYVFSRFFLPHDTVHTTKVTFYEGWAAQGFLKVTMGSEIDFNEIQLEVTEEMGKYPVNEIVYDKWRALQLAQGLKSAGATAVEMPQTVQHLSAPMYELEAAVMSRRLHVDYNPIMNWMASNLVAKPDAKNNVYPRKDREENKIDGMVALIMAIGRLMHREEVTPPDIVFI